MTIESLQYKTVEKEQFEGKERDFFTIFQTRTVLLWLIQRDGENNLGKNLISKILFIMSVKLLCLQLLQSGAQQISCPCSLQKKITGKSPNYVMVSVSAFRLAFFKSIQTGLDFSDHESQKSIIASRFWKVCLQCRH